MMSVNVREECSEWRIRSGSESLISNFSVFTYIYSTMLLRVCHLNHPDCLIHSLYWYKLWIDVLCNDTCVKLRLIESIKICFHHFRPLFLVLGTDFNRNKVKYAKLCFVVLFDTYLLSIKLLTSIASLSLIEIQCDENWLFQFFMVNLTCTRVRLVLDRIAPHRPAELIHPYHSRGL